ncbi:hypothetical protein DFH06DRAFT_1198502 [Mycena polygramma]|nr:hypothetical protein DFH06DRAFT_1198502 [Mycena polygramma]
MTTESQPAPSDIRRERLRANSDILSLSYLKPVIKQSEINVATKMLLDPVPRGASRRQHSLVVGNLRGQHSGYWQREKKFGQGCKEFAMLKQSERHHHSTSLNHAHRLGPAERASPSHPQRILRRSPILILKVRCHVVFIYTRIPSDSQLCPPYRVG